MKYLIMSACFAFASALGAAEYKEHIHEGNKLYWDKKYSDSEIEFRKSLEKQKRNHTATFNLGDALYRQAKYDEAAEKFLDITTQSKDPGTLAKAWHNLGNVYAKKENWESALNAYKNSLRKEPGDKETRYNYEYARQKLMEKQQEQQKGGGGSKNERQDKQQQQDGGKGEGDKQNQDSGREKQNKESGKPGNNGKSDKDKKGNGDSPGENEARISKADAERMLNALNNHEKEVMIKLQKQKAKPRTKKEKNW